MASVLARRSPTCLVGMSCRALVRAPRPVARQSWSLEANCIAPRIVGTRSFRISSRSFEEVRQESAGGKAPEIVRGASKVFKSADEAVADLQSGSVILSAGFGLCGTAGESLEL